jgi:hypothetical protein
MISYSKTSLELCFVTLKLTNMKKMTMMAMAIMLLAACKKDSSIDSLLAGDIESKANGGKQVTRPMKIDIFSSPNPDFVPSPCVDGGGLLFTSGFFVNGNATHLGKIDAKNSLGEDVSCKFVPGERLILETVVAGQITAANGDIIYYTGSDKLDLTDIILGVSPLGTIVGTWTITGGTGRFVGASGSLPIKGIVDVSKPTGGFFTAKADGTITY